MKRTGIIATAVFVTVLCVVPGISASGQTSADYAIPSDVLSGGGGTSQSADYSISASIGQPATVGLSSSADYDDNAGFWPRVMGGEACLRTGDINADNVVTSGDAQLAFQIALGFITPTHTEECAADCNGDSLVTSGDAQLIFQVGLGFPGANCADPLK